LVITVWNVVPDVLLHTDAKAKKSAQLTLLAPEFYF